MLSKLRNKHQAELVISEIPKKHIYVTGHLCSPVTKGQPVGYTNNGHAILTAQVVQILEACEAYVTFETANSIYTINYIQVPSGNYSICA